MKLGDARYAVDDDGGVDKKDGVDGDDSEGDGDDCISDNVGSNT